MGPILAIFLIILFIAGIIALGIGQAKKIKANLAELAARQGLQLVEKKETLGSSQMVVGQKQGREVRFWSYSTGSGKSRRTWAAVGVRPREAGLTFELRRQGFSTKLMQMFGSREITVGDAAFDQEWFVQTNQPEFLQAALVPEIRAKLMAQPKKSRDGSYKLAEGFVQFAEMNTFYSAETITRLEATLPLLHDLADLAEVSAQYRT